MSRLTRSSVSESHAGDDENLALGISIEAPMSTRPGALQSAPSLHSEIQHSAMKVAEPALLRALEALENVPPRAWSVDYGSASGRNSLVPIEHIVNGLFQHGASTQVVLHNDLASSDFSALFRMLEDDESSYLRHPNVFGFAVGRSFYQPIAPPGSVSIGWSAIAAHWLSNAPCEVPDHLWSERSKPDVIAAFREQAASDWQMFLISRAEELHRGGRLVVALAGSDEDGHSTTEHYLDLAEEVMRALISDGVVSEEEFRRMTIPTYFRTPSEIEAPFDGELDDRLELVERYSAPLHDPLWSLYRDTGDSAAFASAYMAWFRALTESTLRSALDCSHETDARLDTIYGRIERSVARAPERVRTGWQIHVVHCVRRDTESSSFDSAPSWPSR